MVKEAVGHSSIGIRVADGDYYKVLDEGSRTKRRVVLTTVNDNQNSVHIDLYRGENGSLAAATFIGSLVIDNIDPAPKGNPEIELVLGIDEGGTLEATASDRATGERQSLSVSMSSLSQVDGEEAPDFSLDERYQPSFGVSPEESSSLTAAGSGIVDAPARERSRPSALRIIAIVFFALVLLAIVALLIYRFALPREHAAPAPAATPPPAAAPAPAPQAAAPAAPAKPTIRSGGVSYYVLWGDNLWDLSLSFYRTPWLYGKIAKANHIKNPDLIFAYTTIYIPDLENH